MPDVILMDMVMPGMDGVDTTRAVLAQYPEVKIVMLTTFSKGDLVREVLEAGAVGFFTKNTDIDILADAVRAAHAGQTILSSEATAALIETKRRPPHLGHDLSKRELETLALLVKGFSKRQIAERLSISPSTAKHHVSACMLKLGADNRAQAAVLAIELQLIPRAQS
jgi:NarL family two-component system response regulator LiaR